MSDALFDILRKVTSATITTMLLKKGIRALLDEWPKAARARRRSRRWPSLHAAFHSGAGRCGHSGELGQSDFDARRG
jgi:hypothetical protein